MLEGNQPESHCRPSPAWIGGSCNRSAGCTCIMQLRKGMRGVLRPGHGGGRLFQPEQVTEATGLDRTGDWAGETDGRGRGRSAK